MKMLFDKAVREGRVQVIKTDDESKNCEPPDSLASAKKEAAEIAKLNRILYESHIEAVFTSEEALALVTAHNN